MSESIVKVPSTASGDMDFLAFSFNGKHSWDDFGIYRVCDGDRYNENLLPTMADKTAEMPGGDGMYFFGTNHKQKDFNINFAFEHLTDSQVKEMKKWLNGKEMGDLWFEEAPYKVWTAKVTGQPSIKYIPFDDFDEQGSKIRVYRGEGSIVFTAYWPYAHTPKAVLTSDGEEKDGKTLSAYADFYNKGQWAAASGLTEQVTPNLVAGDLPTYFTASLTPYTPAVLKYNDPTEEGNLKCIGYFNPSTLDVRLIVQPDPETTEIGRVDDLESYIHWNASGTYNSNPMTNLYAIDLSKTKITSIPSYCFSNSNSQEGKFLEDIKLPIGLQSIGDMFASKSILNARAEQSNEDTYITSNGVEYDRGQIIEGDAKVLYKVGKSNKEKDLIVIQEGTKFLGSYCCNASKAKTIYVPEGVLEIRAGAFQDCKELVSLTIPSTVKLISKWAFGGTDKLTTIYYNGTEAQFDQIQKNVGGDSGISTKTIVCTQEPDETEQEA